MVGNGGSYYGVRTKSKFCLGVSVKYILLAITYFCSFDIYIRRNKRLRQKLLYLCYRMVVLTEVTIYM